MRGKVGSAKATEVEVAQRAMPPRSTQAQPAFPLTRRVRRPEIFQKHTQIRRAELGSESVSTVAASLDLTPNAASAALHRARATLREKLRSFCGDCASGACLDCDCEPS
ncbi:MAG: hypothetical protein H7Y06_06615 [Opitutaceae bacterium]|nr:hypothetical protein [Opitutaceae bacterium]